MPPTQPLPQSGPLNGLTGSPACRCRLARSTRGPCCALHRGRRRLQRSPRSAAKPHRQGTYGQRNCSSSSTPKRVGSSSKPSPPTRAQSRSTPVFVATAPSPNGRWTRACERNPHHAVLHGGGGGRGEPATQSSPSSHTSASTRTPRRLLAPATRPTPPDPSRWPCAILTVCTPRNGRTSSATTSSVCRSQVYRRFVTTLGPWVCGGGSRSDSPSSP